MIIRVTAQHREAVRRCLKGVCALMLVSVVPACSNLNGDRSGQETPDFFDPALVGDTVSAESQGPRVVSEVALSTQRPADLPVLRSSTDAQPEHGSMVLKTFNSRDPYLPEQVDFINELLRFAQTVTVLTEVEEGPLFDPDTQEIWMPGSFANVIEANFGDTDAPVGDVYLHTLVHEVGHVLYDQYDLPLLAREEDAADALASVLLLEYAQDGARVVLNAARMFGLESETSERVEQADFWSEHSLDIQRYYTTLCHVYGSDPVGQARLVNDDYGLSEERAENCEYEYDRIRQGWLDVLKPYLKR